MLENTKFLVKILLQIIARNNLQACLPLHKMGKHDRTAKKYLSIYEIIQCLVDGCGIMPGRTIFVVSNYLLENNNFQYRSCKLKMNIIYPIEP